MSFRGCFRRIATDRPGTCPEIGGTSAGGKRRKKPRCLRSAFAWRKRAGPSLPARLPAYSTLCFGHRTVPMYGAGMRMLFSLSL